MSNRRIHRPHDHVAARRAGRRSSGVRLDRRQDPARSILTCPCKRPARPARGGARRARPAARPAAGRTSCRTAPSENEITVTGEAGRSSRVGLHRGTRRSTSNPRPAGARSMTGAPARRERWHRGHDHQIEQRHELTAVRPSDVESVVNRSRAAQLGHREPEGASDAVAVRSTRQIVQADQLVVGAEMRHRTPALADSGARRPVDDLAVCGAGHLRMS